MKTTQKIKIGGVVYTIQLVPDMKIEDNCSGKAIFGRALIRLDEGLHPDLMSATFLHEILEVINAENEYNLPHRTIQGLATQLFQVIKDNPEVFEGKV